MMESLTPSSVNPSGSANTGSVPPHPRAVHESTPTSGLRETATSVPSGTSELRSLEAGLPAVAVVPAPPQELVDADRSDPTAPSQQQPKPGLQSLVTQSTLVATTTPVGRPATAQSTVRERQGSPTRPPLAHLTMARPTSVGNPGSSTDKLEDVDTLSGIGFPELHRDSAVRTNQPLPALPHARLVDNGVMPTRRQRTLNYDQGSLTRGPDSRRSNVDWIVPLDEKRKRTVTERLQPTLDVATTKRDKHAAKARSTGWALNVAIGLQVLFGSITTGLSAVGTTGRSTAVSTTILGALSTLAASYLARARGSKEPDSSIIRVRDLEHFIREVRAFQLDHGHVDTNEWDNEIDRFRRQLENILVNTKEGVMSTPTA